MEIVPSSAFKMEPINFHQNMRIEVGYQTAITDFLFCAIFPQIRENRNQKIVFKEFVTLFLMSKNICERKIVDEYATSFRVLYVKNSKVQTMKTAELCSCERLKCHFLRCSRDFQSSFNFPFSFWDD